MGPLAPRRILRAMVEYGNGVGQVAGQAGSGGGGGSTSVDVGATVAHIVSQTVNTISSLPPGVLALGLVAIVVGLLILRRAF